jgi:serine/threonine-protein kinase
VVSVVPNVIGSLAMAAMQRLKADGFRTIFVPPKLKDINRAIVTKQSPEPLSRVDPYTRVTVWIEIDSMTTVPNVVSLRGEQVSDAIKEASLTMKAQGVPDAKVPAGVVVAQRPTGGTRVPLESAVLVAYSTGPASVPVPNLVGQTREDAERMIVGGSLRPAFGDTVNSTSNFGRVVWQDPPAGASTPTGSGVRFDIGRRSPDVLVVVPRVIGLTRDSATVALRSVRLLLHFVDSLPDSATASTIVRQRPAPLDRVKPGSDVHVWTARLLPAPTPDSVVVPDLRGLTRDAAIDTIEGHQLNVGRQFAARLGTPGRVAQQDPRPGTKGAVGALVNFWVVPVQDTATTRVPAVTGLLADSALILVEAARLRGALSDDRASREPKHWAVLSQAPPARTRVRVGSAVGLTVEHVPDSVTVPNVKTQGRDRAQLLVGIEQLTFVVGRRPFRFHLRETVVSQTPAGGTRVLRGSTVNVDLSRSLAWPLAAVVPLLALGTVGVRGRWKWPPWGHDTPNDTQPSDRSPKTPLTFTVHANKTRTPPPEMDIAPGSKLIHLAITLEFALQHVDSFVDGIDGPITLDHEDADA